MNRSSAAVISDERRWAGAGIVLNVAPMNTKILTVPGIGNSGPHHWQTLWEQTHAGVTRVQQHDWERPRCGDWVAAIDAAVAACAEPPVIVAHSLGCLALLHWGAVSSAAAVLVLVAVPDPGGPSFPPAAEGFQPLPRTARGRRVLVVTSRDDPYADEAWAAALAADLGADRWDLGAAGHVNADSGLGAWPAGWARVQACVGR
jgi:uncharacterized protein